MKNIICRANPRQLTKEEKTARNRAKRRRKVDLIARGRMKEYIAARTEYYKRTTYSPDLKGAWNEA